ncbi:hypothetical protein BDQ94DRAFT_138294, partial [Aspergillus welwitschiae]
SSGSGQPKDFTRIRTSARSKGVAVVAYPGTEKPLFRGILVARRSGTRLVVHNLASDPREPRWGRETSNRSPNSVVFVPLPRSWKLQTRRYLCCFWVSQLQEFDALHI